MTQETMLVATDGSHAAQAAACVAIEIAATLHMALHGVYIVDEALALDSYARPEKELGIERGDLSRSDLIRKFEMQGDLALRWLEARATEAGVPVSTDMLAGGVPELVLREAEGAHALALGRRGNSHGVGADSLGRHFVQIAHHAQLPLLVGGTTSQPVHRLLVACDHKDAAGKEFVWAARLYEGLSAEVVVLCLDGELRADGEQRSPSEIRSCLAASDLNEYRLVVEQGDPARQIPAAADNRRADLIVMGRYRHRVIVDRLLGSTIDRVLRATALPVLLV